MTGIIFINCTGTDRNETYAFRDAWASSRTAKQSINAVHEAVAAYLAENPDAEGLSLGSLDEIPSRYFFVRGLIPQWTVSAIFKEEHSLDESLEGFAADGRKALLEYHDLYLRTLDLQAQLENGQCEDEAGAEKEKQMCKLSLASAGFNPDEEPEYLQKIADAALGNA